MARQLATSIKLPIYLKLYNQSGRIPFFFITSDNITEADIRDRNDKVKAVIKRELNYDESQYEICDDEERI